MGWLCVANFFNNSKGRVTSTIKQSLDDIELELSDARGTSSSLQMRIDDIDGEAAATAELVSSVVDANGNIKSASIIQAVNAESSDILISADKIGLISSEQITMNGGVVFVKTSDIYAAGTTQIDGGKINTETLEVNAAKIKGAIEVLSTSNAILFKADKSTNDVIIGGFTVSDNGFNGQNVHFGPDGIGFGTNTGGEDSSSYGVSISQDGIMRAGSPVLGRPTFIGPCDVKGVISSIKNISTTANVVAQDFILNGSYLSVLIRNLSNRITALENDGGSGGDSGGDSGGGTTPPDPSTCEHSYVECNTNGEYADAMLIFNSELDRGTLMEIGDGIISNYSRCWVCTTCGDVVYTDPFPHVHDYRICTSKQEYIDIMLAIDPEADLSTISGEADALDFANHDWKVCINCGEVKSVGDDDTDHTHNYVTCDCAQDFIDIINEAFPDDITKQGELRSVAESLDWDSYSYNVCSICCDYSQGDAKLSECEQNGHTWVYNFDYCEDECSVCGDRQPHEHRWTYVGTDQDHECECEATEMHSWIQQPDGSWTCSGCGANISNDDYTTNG